MGEAYFGSCRSMSPAAPVSTNCLPCRRMWIIWLLRRPLVCPAAMWLHLRICRLLWSGGSHNPAPHCCAVALIAMLTLASEQLCAQLFRMQNHCSEADGRLVPGAAR